MSVVIAILIFGLIIAIHELGHFCTAKWSGITVFEFAIGMGPKIFSFKKGETTYSLRCIPFGGFCAMGEDDIDANSTRPQDGESETAAAPIPLNPFSSKPVWKRIIVIAAGAIMNLLLAFVLIMIMTAGYSEDLLTAQIRDFKTNSSSASVLEKGDVIKKIDGKTVFSDEDLRFLLLISKGDEHSVTVERNGKILNYENVTFKTRVEYYFDSEKNANVVITSETPAPDGVEILISESPIDFFVVHEEMTTFATIGYTFRSTASYVQLVFVSLEKLIKGEFSIKEMSGPVGVVGAVAQTYDKSAAIKNNIYNMLFITVLITVNLGVFNLLPLPALDGGRLVFLVIEGVLTLFNRKGKFKKIPISIEARIHTVGFMLLMAFTLFITFNDVINLLKPPN